MESLSQISWNSCPITKRNSWLVQRWVSKSYMTATWLDLFIRSEGKALQKVHWADPVISAPNHWKQSKGESTGIPLAPWQVLVCAICFYPLVWLLPFLRAFVLTMWGLLILEKHFLFKTKEEKTSYLGYPFNFPSELSSTLIGSNLSE